MCICVALWSIITTTIRHVYMCCLMDAPQGNNIYRYTCICCCYNAPQGNTYTHTLLLLWSIITTTIRYVYMCCLVEHYNNNNKACVYVLL